MSSQSWTNEKILQFLDRIRLSPVLWDTKHLEYKNKPLRRDAWNVIAEEFNVTNVEAQKKFKNLRTYFYYEFKKREKYGDSSESSWFAFKSLLFLTGVDFAEDLEIENDSDVHTRTHSEQVFLYEDSNDDVTRPIQKPRKRKLNNFEFTNNEKRKTKESSIFCEYVLSKLDRYNDFVRSQVEYKISTILYQADMGFYNKQLLKPPNDMPEHQSSSSSFFNVQKPSTQERNALETLDVSGTEMIIKFESSCESYDEPISI